MSEELVGTMLPSELVDEVEELIPTILLPEGVLEPFLRLRVRVCRGVRCVEGVGIANSNKASRSTR